MKKILFILLLLAHLPVLAQHHGHHRGHHGYSRNPWVYAAPVISGYIAYDLMRYRAPIYYPPTIVEQYPQPIYTPACSEWREIQAADGSIYRERSCVR